MCPYSNPVKHIQDIIFKGCPFRLPPSATIDKPTIINPPPALLACPCLVLSVLLLSSPIFFLLLFFFLLVAFPSFVESLSLIFAHQVSKNIG